MKLRFETVSIADWIKIAGTLGGGIVTLIGFVVWLTHVDAGVSVVTDAQAAMKADIAADRMTREKHEEEVLDQLRDMNTRLSRIEGMQKAVWNEVKTK